MGYIYLSNYADEFGGEISVSCEFLTLSLHITNLPVVDDQSKSLFGT